MWCSTVGFLVTLMLSMLAAPLVAGAQPAGKVPTIGFLTHNAAPQTARDYEAFEAFVQGLRALGYIEGQTITIERRYAEGHLERVPALVADLAARHIDVFVVTNNLIAKAVQQTTPQSPIVMLVAEEPVTSGLVQSLAHPGGTITGMATVPGAAIYGKNLAFLKEALPPGSRIGVLFNATVSDYSHYLPVTEEVAQGLQVTLVPAEVRSPEDFEAAMAVMQDGKARGFVVLSEPMIAANTERINALALRHGLAVMWPTRRGAVAGGLLSYGDNPLERWRHAATYVDKILKGAKPGDLPMAHPMHFELVINLKTAQALGLAIPPSLLFQANEVIR
jgi:putative tryptophan/tyrosine transport system substrate-binding protein